MLPAHVAENIRKQILFYLESTFFFADERVQRALEDFLVDPDSGLFKGPWVQLRRPFRPAPEDYEAPFDIATHFHPFHHQYIAWDRLSSIGANKAGERVERRPESTIVTTGTGSGKTECFLFPLLDHCCRARKSGQRGIKAIILYPMNALASDQEKRFAAAVYKDETLRSSGLRVGNYTGRYDPANPGYDTGSRFMGERHGITSHSAQQDDPPDILLTNYKMLDYLLLRPQDQGLWRYNEPGVLRYLVLDELHTYDGAQGSDVACLIRRLKERLSIPRGGLCCIGTSATLDDRSVSGNARERGHGRMAEEFESPEDRLARFAGKLFEESIPVEAIIGENRLDVAEIVPDPQTDPDLPDPGDCRPLDREDAFEYAARQATLWGAPPWEPPPAGADEEAVEKARGDWELTLGAWLKDVRLFKYLLDLFASAEPGSRTSGDGGDGSRETLLQEPVAWSALVEALGKQEQALRDMERVEDRQAVVASFFALVAQASELRSGKSFPLVPTQVQLWVRELRRLGRVVEATPKFSWLDEPPPDLFSLPTFHCSECGESGWIARHDISKDALIQSRGVSGLQLDDDPRRIYQEWFLYGGESSRTGQFRGEHIAILSPLTDEQAAKFERSGGPEGGQMELPFMDRYLCPGSLVVRSGKGPCPLTGDTQLFRVKVDMTTRQLDDGRVVGDQGCPNCGSKIGVFFVGSQAATLSSLAIDEMFGSPLNSEAKLLAFTDSVQDASHRAGYFTARTYRFTFRTALQHLVDDSGEAGVPLHEAGKRILEYWAQPRARWQGGMKNALSILMPADLQEYQPFLDYRNNPDQDNPPPELLETIAQRLTWEATSEFGVMQTHGRTLEPSASTAIAWDEEQVAGTLAMLRERLEGISPRLADIEDGKYRLWLLGILYRYRERGAVHHPYLTDYARHNYWGKNPFGRHYLAERETYPPGIRFRPHLLVTERDRDHEHFTAASRGSLPPWHLVWTRRALDLPAMDENTLLDLIRALANVAVEAGLFHRVHESNKKQYYAISAKAARLVNDCVHLRCSETKRSMVRPRAEADVWICAPSKEYYAESGTYAEDDFTPRQHYYRDRYRRGALRRVVAREHTGLLGTEEREALEKQFHDSARPDDPNILACTSTLEMGIDIGDLSSTMLCSIPPTTANYLQRIGRAGRATGTALIVSFVNQRPHDLFFYARPSEMLKGRVEPPGCWLDAAAVLARQYLAFCFDSASKEKILKELPRSAVDLHTDVISPGGNIPTLMAWVAGNEKALQDTFLGRFTPEEVHADTRDRLREQTRTDLLLHRIQQAAQTFNLRHRDLINARDRLSRQRAELDPSTEEETLAEIEQELSLVNTQLASMRRTPALEVLTDEGLLPNYAFPERGVKFYGAVYNKYREEQKNAYKPIELTRGAGAALKDFGPHNIFYTHSRQFEIQQYAVGNKEQPLSEEFAICAACGHLRPAQEVRDEGDDAKCPQCELALERTRQRDVGQQHDFLELSRSEARSFMEHYESLSGDSNEERQPELYSVVRSYDLTLERPSGAVGEEGLPFGIQYHDALLLREVNVGYHGCESSVQFGPNQGAPLQSYKVCRNCGVVLRHANKSEPEVHRRSCIARRKYEKAKRQGNETDPFEWENLYLYRRLQSEGIRLLLPLADDEDLDTLTACIHLGLRLRFEGNPSNLIIAPQVMPDPERSIDKRYLVLLDEVPGGTGFLKALYQEHDEEERPGEGIMDILRKALIALETCPCRKLIETDADHDPDGCYRCIRTYHLQYSSQNISRERGISLLNRLIRAGEKRLTINRLEDIKTTSIFDSLLEKTFIGKLREFVERNNGTWKRTLIHGMEGYRFTLENAERIWEVEMQPSLGIGHGVMIQSQPDFLLTCDDREVNPIAIFTDGFKYHCHPRNRLSDDLQKRRAILASGNYHVWSITWDDLREDNRGAVLFSGCLLQQIKPILDRISESHPQMRDIVDLASNGFRQLTGFINKPTPETWKAAAELPALASLAIARNGYRASREELHGALDDWRATGELHEGTFTGDDWRYAPFFEQGKSIIPCISATDLDSLSPAGVNIIAALADGAEDVHGEGFRTHWRRFLVALNLFQFATHFSFCTHSEVDAGVAPEIVLRRAPKRSNEWDPVTGQVTTDLRRYLPRLAQAGIPLPAVEYYLADESEAFAELAWPDLAPPVAFLYRQQGDFAAEWKAKGWTVIRSETVSEATIDEIIAAVTGEPVEG